MLAIQEIMKSNVLVVSPTDTLKDVILLMGKNHVSGLCVVDRQRRILGVITEFDLLRAFHDDRTHEKVKDIMSSSVITVGPEATLDELIELFLEKRMRRVFVAEDGVLQGVISRRDLIFAAQCRKQVSDFHALQA